MTVEDEIRARLFGKKNNPEIEELNECNGCHNLFKRFIGEACTMTCFYRNVL